MCHLKTSLLNYQLPFRSGRSRSRQSHSYCRILVYCIIFYIQHHVSKLSDRYIYRYDDMHQSRSVLKTMFKTHVKRVIFFNFCKRKDVLVMSLENSVQQTFLGIESIEVRASNLQFMNMTTTITFHHEKLF